MSKRAESSSVSAALRSSAARLRALPYPVGEETGLPLIPCPYCGRARVIELRVKVETANKGRSFFKCPRNGVCDFYKWPKQYLATLIEKKIIIVKCEMVEELEEMWDDGTDHGITDVNMGMDKVEMEKKELEKKLENLAWKQNFFFVLVVTAVFGMVVRSFVST